MSRIASEVRVNERQGVFLMGPSRSLQELCGAVAASAANVHAGFGLLPSSSGAHPEKEIVMEWYLATFRKYFDFNGRARRKEYWIFTLINFLISMVLYTVLMVTSFSGSVDGGLGTSSISLILSSVLVLYWLATFLPGLGVTVRRLHDTGRSGWWFFIGLIPLIGGIVLLVYLCQDGAPEENRYGANPKQAAW